MPATSDVLGRLHELVAQELIKRIEKGEATAADLGQAIKLLKDNNITAVPTGNNALGKLVGTLADRLPFTDVEDVPLLN